jgi:PE family
MSFVITEPELVQGAAQDLAGIRSSLAEATSTVAGPTTGMAAAAQDEVSVAIASMFGNYGQEFQALSAQAQAFHAQFVTAMNGSAAAYVGAEAANAGQTLLGGGVLGNIGQNIGGAVAGGQAAFGQLGGSLNGAVTALQNGSFGALASAQIQGGAQAFTAAPAAAPTLIQGINAFGATVAAPYQALVINTNNNLAAINSTFMANPFPFAFQFLDNQFAYGQTFGAGLAASLQGFPANVPANIQLAIQGASTFNPAALAQQFITNQQGYAFTIGSSLQLAGQDLNTGLQTLPAAFQAAFQDLLAGNPIDAGSAIGQGLENAFLPGFSITEDLDTFVLTITPIGPLGDLAPVFTIPGQMAQNFTDLLPPGSIPAQMAQNGTSLVEALTNFGTTLGLTTGDLNFGVPLQLVLDGIGGPANALSALNSTGVAFAGAMQAGNASAAAAAVLDAPAVIANGYLNGTTLVTLPPASFGDLLPGVTSTTIIPLGGILTPLSLPLLFLNSGGESFQLTLAGGTGIGGIIPGLLSAGEQLAGAITPTT